MKSRFRWIAGFSLLLFAVIVSQAQSYDSELKLGVDAYKKSHFEEAIEHFRNATQIDPSQTDAHLYLAGALVSQYIPGVELPDNVALAEQAIEQYQHVLDSDAGPQPKITSVNGIAGLYFNMERLDDAKTYYQKASALDPNDPDPYYSIGAIDWTLTFRPRMKAREGLGMAPQDSLNSRIADQRKVCDDLRTQNMSTVEEGIDSLHNAIKLRPDYDDAMAYVNLMYRERADLECDDLAARAEDLKTADHWVDMTMAVKKAKAKKAEGQNQPTAPNPQ